MSTKIIVILYLLIAFAVIAIIATLGSRILYLSKESFSYYAQEAYNLGINQIAISNMSNSSKEAIINQINSIYQNMIILLNNTTYNG
jgi:hypothetical protein